MAAQKILDKGSYSKIVIDEHDPGSVLKITDSTDYDNIIREVACLSYLNHPNIIRPTFIEFMPDGTCLIKMERYPYNLHEYMKKHGTIPIIRTIHMLIELLSAITYMHKNMIIHGDIKPKNILVADYISIMCLCLMPNRHKRARSDQALYLMLNLYKKIVSDSLIIDRLMYGIEISAGVQTCHTNFDKNSKNYKPLNQLTIIKYMPADMSKLFNFSSINYANRLLLKYAKKSAEWQKDISVYTILFITMSVCGEAHRDIVDALEEKFTKRQLYNHAVRILVALDFLIFD